MITYFYFYGYVIIMIPFPKFLLYIIHMYYVSMCIYKSTAIILACQFGSRNLLNFFVLNINEKKKSDL